MTPKSIRALLLTALLSSVADAAQAACSDRPGTPTNVTARLLQGTLSEGQIQVSWTNTATETVYWDIEITNERNVIVQRPRPGLGRGDTGKGHRFSNTFTADRGQTLCFRVKARTEPGTKGCVSQLWSNRACATAPGAPSAPPRAQAGAWAAVAADSKGRWGWAVGQQSEAVARQKAMAGCGLPGCKLLMAAQQACVGYAESSARPYSFGVSIVATKAAAESVAMDWCAKGAPRQTCKVRETHCR